DWIIVVNDYFWQHAILIEPIEIASQSAGLREIADGIKAGVRTNLPEASRICVPQGAQVKLLRPAFFRIETAEQKHHIGSELHVFFRRCGLPAAGFFEYRGGRFLRAEIGVALVHAVVRQPAPAGVEEFMSL